MKKFAKRSLIFAGILFTVGVVILIICSFFAGGRLRHALSDTVSTELHRALPGSLLYLWNDNYNHRFNRHYPTHSGSYTDDNAAKASDITELYIELNYADFTLAPSQDDSFHVSSEGSGKYQYYTDDSVFYLNGSFDHHIGSFNKLTLEVPNIDFSNVNIDFGAGTANLSSLKSDSLSISIASGELTLDGADCDYISTEVGAGSASIKNGQTQNANFEIGMGKLDYTGYIDADLVAEVGMGNITLLIGDTQEEHNYDLECAMGNITLGQKSYGGMVLETEIDNQADSNYLLECGMGNIDITFQNIK